MLALYGHVMDARDIASLSAVFTADAVFDVTAADGAVHRGLAEITRFLELADAVHPPFHALTNAWVGVEEGEVRSRSKWITVDRETGLPRSGDYLDVWRREPEGWRIAHRVARLRWAGGGWDGGYAELE